jgi:hypothetical protein
MNTTQRSRTTTLRILPSHIGQRTPELDLALSFDPKTRTYHHRDSK